MSEYISTSRRAVLWLIVAGGLMLGGSAWAGGKVAELRCEHRTNPAGIDTRTPRLSWQLVTTERAQTQYAYQIRVASSRQKLRAGTPDRWDSGQVVTHQSVLVPYSGEPLQSHQECFWQVRVWTAPNQVTRWSEPAQWSMGILQPDEWRAEWIGWDEPERVAVLTNTSWVWYPEGNPAVTAPLETNWFRREISLPADRKVKRAIFEYTGDNECRGWLDEFDLGARNNPRAVKWNDITTRLHPGQTYVFGLVGRNTGTNANPAGVIGLLTIEFEAGEPLIVCTDESWQVTKEFQPGWNKPGFDASHWATPKVLGPAGMSPWGETRTAEAREFPARWLRKEFTVAKKLQRAVVYYSGLGTSELYVNGQKAGDAVLSPAVAQYDQRAFYVTHDITALLRRGANALGVVLGGGRFASDRSKIYTGTINFGWPKLKLHLRLEYTDGTSTEVGSDASWQLTTDGPIRTSGEYDGEAYDARRELPGWSEPGYAASKGFTWPWGDAEPQPATLNQIERLTTLPRWQPVQLVAAPGPLSAQLIEPIRVTQTLHPVAHREIRPGVWIYDLGQNMVGWVQLRVKGPAGQQVQLRFAETLNPDGSLNRANLRSAKATDTYILKGQGREIWAPRFTYHGFRYVEVTGYPGRPKRNAILGQVVHDDLPLAGDFHCSHPLLNQIYRNIVWGTRGNYRSLPTDCPQRDERQGWLGDRAEVSRGETYLFAGAPLYAKWLQDIGDAQKPNGSLPDVAPAFWPIYSDNVTWPSTLLITPEILFRHYGDAAPMAARYDQAHRWLDYMRRFVTNGIIAKDAYGDWCVPPEAPQLIHSKDPARQTDRALLATAYFYLNLRLMERYATRLNQPAEAQAFADQAAEMKAAFNAKFFRPNEGYYDNGSQTSGLLPLAFGLVPDESRGRVFAQLTNNIEFTTQGHIGTGLIGGQHLCRVLSDYGRADLVFELATKTNYPGWGYMVANGATTIWELWNGNTADPTMNSGNHVMLVGDLVVWFYEYLAGIAPDPAQPGFKHILMKPHPVGDLTHVRATHQSPYGRISSAWRRPADFAAPGARFEWQVEIPPNTTATLYVPLLRHRQVTEGGLALGPARGVKLLRREADRLVVQLASGKYQLVSE